jgi:hypothetical protein
MRSISAHRLVPMIASSTLAVVSSCAIPDAPSSHDDGTDNSPVGDASLDARRDVNSSDVATGRDGGGAGGGSGGTSGSGGMAGATGGKGGATGGAAGTAGKAGSTGSGGTGAAGGTGGATGGSSGSGGSTGGSGGAIDASVDTGTGGGTVVDASVDNGPTCPSDQKLCGSACVSKTDPGYGCAATSCAPCAFPNAASTCSSGGACAQGSCHSNYADCNTDSKDGCETDLSKPATCGSCTKACDASAPLCSNTNGTFQCVTGCTAPASTLCGSQCVDTQTNVNHCSKCDTKCAGPSAHGSVSCTGGQCVTTCAANYTVCGTECVDTKNDLGHCGGCSQACTKSCVQGLCCTAGQSNCNGVCSDTSSDLANCGGCGRACNGTCTSGTCCAPGLTYCNGVCVDTQTSAAHCGGCGKTCSGTCNAGSCCAAGNSVCSGVCCSAGQGCCGSPAACTQLDNPTNCGSCGNTCANGQICNASKQCETLTWCAMQPLPPGVGSADYQCVDFDKGSLPTNWSLTQTGSGAAAISSMQGHSLPNAFRTTVLGLGTGTLSWSTTGTSAVTRMDLTFQIWRPYSKGNPGDWGGAYIDLACVRIGSGGACLTYQGTSGFSVQFVTAGGRLPAVGKIADLDNTQTTGGAWTHLELQFYQNGLFELRRNGALDLSESWQPVPMSASASATIGTAASSDMVLAGDFSYDNVVAAARR